MNQNQVKLIAIDMDGTLLDSQKEKTSRLFRKPLRQVLRLSFVRVVHVQALFPILKNWVLVKKSTLS